MAKKNKLEKRARREEETNRIREEETKAKLEAAVKLKAAVAGRYAHSLSPIQSKKIKTCEAYPGLFFGRFLVIKTKSS